MGEILRFTVPGAPVPCGRARVVRNQRADGSKYTRTFSPDKTAAYEAKVALFAKLAMSAHRWKAPKGAAFAVRITVYREARRGDWDNFGKGICDGLTKAGVWEDDRLVEHASVVMYVDRVNPRAQIEVGVIG